MLGRLIRSSFITGLAFLLMALTMIAVFVIFYYLGEFLIDLVF